MSAQSGAGPQSEPGARTSIDRADAGALVKASESMAADFVDHLHGRIVAAIDDSVKVLKENLFDHADQFGLYEELKFVLASKDKMAEALKAAFSRHYHKTLESDPSGAQHYFGSTDAEPGGFSLVDDNQLEEWLTIDKMVARIQDRCGDELAHLEERFRHLLPQLKITRHRLPLGPDKICHAFHDALEALNVSTATRAHCYGLLDTVLTGEAGNLYSSVNQFLARKGVLPTLRSSPKTESRERARSENRTADSGTVQSAAVTGRGHEQPGARGPVGSGMGAGGGTAAADTAPGSAGAMPLKEQMFEAIQTLLRAHFAQSVEGEGAVVDGIDSAVIELPVTPMLIDTLSALQHDESAVERSGELIRGGLRHFVHGRYSASGAQAGRINQIDDETIEVITLIFDYILDDQTLPDFMKALIGRLQIPILKVAIVDRGFFSRKNHPARQLLNELAQAGSGWRDENDAAKDRLYEKLESIVRRILKEFESDITIFEVLLSELRAFLEEETRRFNEAQERLGAAAREAERVERIKAQVVQDIAARLIGHEIPEDLRDFLVVPWRQFITAVTLAEDADSETRSRALRLIDDLLWSVTPKRSAAERRRLTAMLPAILETIRHGLAHIEYGDRETEDFISTLERHHFVSLKAGARAERQAVRAARQQAAPGESPVSSYAADTGAIGEPAARSTDVPEPDTDTEIDGLPEVDWERLASFDDVVDPNRLAGSGTFEKMLAEMEATPERDDGPRIEDEFTELVRNLKVGTWVELPADGGGDVRAKLAWKDEHFGGYSFVNRQFKVVAERPLYVLADEFRRGSALVIDNVALFDRAVDGVISGIMKLAGASGR